MSEQFNPIVHPSAWRGESLRREDICIALESVHVDALQSALRACRSNGIATADVRREHFALPGCEALQNHVRESLSDGVGVVILQGFPVHEHALEDIELMYWGFASNVGVALPQSAMGDSIGHVTDVSGKDPNERAYRNSLEIPPHTDSADVVTMLSLRRAKSGGLSTYTSALAIHNELLTTRPDLLAPLYHGYRVHCFGEQAPGEPPVTSYRVPVLDEHEGYVSACIVPEYIDMAEVELGEPMPPLEREAFDTFMALANDPALRFDIMLEPGDLSLTNNHTVLHSRTAFDDHAADDQRRYLLRLWLECHERRPLSPRFNGGQPQGIAPQAGRASTYFAGDAAKLANRGRYGEVD